MLEKDRHRKRVILHVFSFIVRMCKLKFYFGSHLLGGSLVHSTHGSFVGLCNRGAFFDLGGTMLMFKSSYEKRGHCFMERSVAAFWKHYHEGYISLLGTDFAFLIEVFNGCHWYPLNVAIE